MTPQQKQRREDIANMVNPAAQEFAPYLGLYYDILTMTKMTPDQKEYVGKWSMDHILDLYESSEPEEIVNKSHWDTLKEFVSKQYEKKKEYNKAPELVAASATTKYVWADDWYEDFKKLRA